MEIKNLLIDILNNKGLYNYTFFIFFLGILSSHIYDLILYLNQYFCEKTLKIIDERKQIRLLNKELNKNGS
jgi:hypothetical protein